MFARFFCCLLVASMVAGCTAPTETAGKTPAVDRPRGDKPFVGVYIQQAPDVGSGYRMEIRPDGKWAMANLSSGFWGRWKDAEGKVTLTIIDGSSGKLSEPITLTPLYDGFDEVLLGEEWGPGPFRRQPAAPYIISFAETSLAR